MPSSSTISMFSLLKSANTMLESVLTCDDDMMLGRSFWEQEDLKGILLLSVLEAGCLVSRSVGTGLLFARRSIHEQQGQQEDQQQHQWSPPCAVAMGGLGGGLMIGASHKDVMVFLFDEASVLALTGDVGLTLGAQAEFTLLNPKGGRHVNWKTVISNQGHIMTTVAVSISRGLMVGMSLEGTIIQPNTMVNESFYQQSYTPIQILYDVQEEEMFLSPPNTTSDVTNQEENIATMRKLLRNVYIQLEQLRRGDTWEPPSSSPSDDDMKLNENLK